jgi:hypothetical protein
MEGMTKALITRAFVQSGMVGLATSGLTVITVLTAALFRSAAIVSNDS